MSTRVVALPQEFRGPSAAKTRAEVISSEARRRAADDGVDAVGIALGATTLIAALAAFAMWRRRRIAAEGAEKEAARRAAAIRHGASGDGLPGGALGDVDIDAQIAGWAAAESEAAKSSSAGKSAELHRTSAGAAGHLLFRGENGEARIAVRAAAVDRVSTELASDFDLSATALGVDALLVFGDAAGGATVHPVLRVEEPRRASDRLRVAASGPGVAFPRGVRRESDLRAEISEGQGRPAQIRIVELGIDGAEAEGAVLPSPDKPLELWIQLDDDNSVETPVECVAGRRLLDGALFTLAFVEMSEDARARVAARLYRTALAEA